MRKSDALSLVLSASAVLCCCSAAVYDRDSRFSTTEATVQQPCADQKKERGSVPCLISPGPKNHLYSSEFLPDGAAREYSGQSNFSQRLAGGILRHFELGLIVVDSTAVPETVQPTALTTDAIITSSVRSKIAGQSQLPPGDFEIQTDDGVVTIRSKEESLDQAAAVINLALCVPDVRQIVYTMPSSVWRTAGGETYRRRGVGAYDLWLKLRPLHRQLELSD